MPRIFDPFHPFELDEFLRQVFADRAAQWLVVAAIVTGLVTFTVWFGWIGKPLLFAMTLMISVFVIACPGRACVSRHRGRRR
jgi:cation transport ATPase